MAPVVIAWIAAYTICLVNVGLLLHHYLRGRKRNVLYFLLLVSDTLFVTVVVMVLVMTVDGTRLFDVILTNCLLTYYVTVPLLVYEALGLKRPDRLIAVVLVGSAAAFNLLVLIRLPLFVYALYWAPLAALIVPAMVRGRKTGRRSTDDEELSINRTGVTIGGVALLLGIVYILLMRTPLSRSGFFVNAYFAFFTLIYQAPITHLCLTAFPPVSAGRGEFAGASPVVPDPGGLRLTAREQEVALKLYEGLKYEEIARELFVSLSAVKKHVYNIYRKTGVRNNRQLIRRLIDAGQTPPHAG